MARICELSGKKPLSGHSVSHSEIKTKRRFLPNLQNMRFFSEALGGFISLRVSVRAAKGVEKKGGIDAWLLGKGNSKLTPQGKAAKAKIAAATARKGV